MVTKNNIYLLTFGGLWILYVLNEFAIIYNIKIFNILIPMVLSVYLYKKLSINTEIRILLLFILSLFISQFLSTFNSQLDQAIIIPSTMRIIVILFLLIPFYTIYKMNSKLFDNIFIFSIFIILVSNFYYYFYLYTHMERFRGTFGNPNEFALLLSFSSYYLLYYMYIYPVKPKLKILLITMLGLSMILVLITLSRSGIIILLFLYLFYYLAIKKSLSFFKKIILLILVISVLYLIYITFSSEFLLLIDRFSGAEGKSSSNMRNIQNAAAIQTLHDNSIIQWLFGNGTSASSSLDWFSKYHTNFSSQVVHRIHNSLIALLVENGLIGLGLYLFLHLIIFFKLFKLKNQYKYLLLGYLLGAIMYSQMAYIVYFFPYWLSLIIISIHANQLKDIK